MNGNDRVAQARLEIVPDQKGKSDRVTLTLRNVGDVPIVVDRDMVFGVTIDVAASGGKSIPLHAVRSSAPTTTDVKKRLFPLKPGESVSRAVNLRRGWTVLRGGTGRSALPSGQPLVTGFEETVQIPKEATLTKVTVRYGDTPGFWDAFLGYTGMTVQEAALFDGPLVQTIEFVK